MLYTSLESAPGAIELRLKLGENLLEPQQLQLEEAAANLLLVAQQMPDYDRAHELFGYAMSKRGALDNAYDSLTEALRLNPKNANARATLARVQNLMGDYIPSQPPSRPFLSVYPSKAPHILRQVRGDQSGNLVTDGIEVEFYENGRLKYFADKFVGKLNGLEMTWGSDGRLLSRKAYRDNVLIDKESGS
jgi:tetratricopeptide (TPR) repeat protein